MHFWFQTADESLKPSLCLGWSLGYKIRNNRWRCIRVEGYQTIRAMPSHFFMMDYSYPKAFGEAFHNCLKNTTFSTSDSSIELDLTFYSSYLLLRSSSLSDASTPLVNYRTSFSVFFGAYNSHIWTPSTLLLVLRTLDALWVSGVHFIARCVVKSWHRQFQNIRSQFQQTKNRWSMFWIYILRCQRGALLHFVISYLSVLSFKLGEVLFWCKNSNFPTYTRYMYMYM